MCYFTLNECILKVEMGEKALFYLQGCLPLDQREKETTVSLTVNGRSGNEFRSEKCNKIKKKILINLLFFCLLV